MITLYIVHYYASMLAYLSIYLSNSALTRLTRYVPESCISKTCAITLERSIILRIAIRTKRVLLTTMAVPLVGECDYPLALNIARQVVEIYRFIHTTVFFYLYAGVEV